MSRIIARFVRGKNRVKFIRDVGEEGYYTILTQTAERTTVERKLRRYCPLVIDLYTKYGYTRLQLCPACEGEGIVWGQDGRGDVQHDVCQACAGEGGTEA